MGARAPMPSNIQLSSVPNMMDYWTIDNGSIPSSIIAEYTGHKVLNLNVNSHAKAHTTHKAIRTGAPRANAKQHPVFQRPQHDGLLNYSQMQCAPPLPASPV